MTDKKKEVLILSIHKACQKGNYDAVVAQLKKKKNNVNLEDETGHTPIQLAALHGSFDVVQLLVENGADLNQQDPSGWCALHFAASGRNEKLFAYLLSQENINGERNLHDQNSIFFLLFFYYRTTVACNYNMNLLK